MTFIFFSFFQTKIHAADNQVYCVVKGVIFFFFFTSWQYIEYGFQGERWENFVKLFNADSELFAVYFLKLIR